MTRQQFFYPLPFALSPLPSPFLLQGFGRFKNLFRAGAHPVILREVGPANGAGRVQQELSRPGNVLAIDSLPCVDKIVPANRFQFRIRKERERVPGFLTEIARYFRRVDTNGNRTNSYLMKFIQTLLNAPQLGVA